MILDHLKDYAALVFFVFFEQCSKNTIKSSDIRFIEGYSY